MAESSCHIAFDRSNVLEVARDAYGQSAIRSYNPHTLEVWILLPVRFPGHGSDNVILPAQAGGIKTRAAQPRLLLGRLAKRLRLESGGGDWLSRQRGRRVEVGSERAKYGCVRALIHSDSVPWWPPVKGARQRLSSSSGRMGGVEMAWNMSLVVYSPARLV